MAAATTKTITTTILVKNEKECFDIAKSKGFIYFEFMENGTNSQCTPGLEIYCSQPKYENLKNVNMNKIYRLEGACGRNFFFCSLAEQNFYQSCFFSESELLPGNSKLNAKFHLIKMAFSKLQQIRLPLHPQKWTFFWRGGG